MAESLPCATDDMQAKGHMDKHHPGRTHTITVIRTKDKALSFCIEDGCLLIQVRQDYPMPLCAQDTHSLLNLLLVHKESNIDASKAQQKTSNRKHYEASDWMASLESDHEYHSF